MNYTSLAIRDTVARMGMRQPTSLSRPARKGQREAARGSELMGPAGPTGALMPRQLAGMPTQPVESTKLLAGTCVALRPGRGGRPERSAETL